MSGAQQPVSRSLQVNITAIEWRASGVRVSEWVGECMSDVEYCERSEYVSDCWLVVRVCRSCHGSKAREGPVIVPAWRGAGDLHIHPHCSCHPRVSVTLKLNYTCTLTAHCRCRMQSPTLTILVLVSLRTRLSLSEHCRSRPLPQPEQEERTGPGDRPDPHSGSWNDSLDFYSLTLSNKKTWLLSTGCVRSHFYVQAVIMDPSYLGRLIGNVHLIGLSWCSVSRWTN